jgi:hypothetical protein
MAEQQHPIREAIYDFGALFIVLGGIALLGAGVHVALR